MILSGVMHAKSPINDWRLFSQPDRPVPFTPAGLLEMAPGNARPQVVSVPIGETSPLDMAHHESLKRLRGHLTPSRCEVPYSPVGAPRSMPHCLARGATGRLRSGRIRHTRAEG